MFRGIRIVPKDPDIHLPTDASAVRWGSSHRSGNYFGHLAPGSTGTAHQLFGAESCSTGSPVLDSEASRSTCSSRTRQLHCSGVCEQTEWSSFNPSVQVSETDSSVMSSRRDCSASKTYSREQECPSRFTIKGRSNSDHSVVSESESISVLDPAVGDTNNRPVRHQKEHSTSSLRLADSRSWCSSRRWTVSQLEGSVGIRLSSTRSPTSSRLKDPSRPMSDYADRPVMARGSMVHRAVESSHRSASCSDSDILRRQDNLLEPQIMYSIRTTRWSHHMSFCFAC